MNAMAKALLDLDLPALRALSALQPHLPQPGGDREVLVTAHMARTSSDALPLKARAYSHRWLLDQGYPSQLPDELKPRAERIYPVVAEGVGIFVMGQSELGRAVAPLVRKAMSDAVEECYADGRREASIVKPRMMEARSKEIRALLGRR